MGKYTKEGGIYMDPDRNHPFPYSDGDEAENYIMELVSKADDVSTGSQELVMGIRDWPSLYHLSPKRADLVRPLEARLQGKSILEIGSGCGALTRYFGEMEGKVVALEGSERRARITAARCRDLGNVQVVCDNFETFSWDESFDVITLIGVLEYSNLFIKGAFPPLEMLHRIKKFLKPGGVLVIAIENKLGLKYWAGAPEDHTGQVFFGIEGYYSGSTAITFGRKELKDLLSHAGYIHSTFLYPFPDYKLPDVVLKEEAFENPHFEVLNLLYEKLDYDQGLPHETFFSPTRAAHAVHLNQLLPDLSNSFLVLCSLSTADILQDSATLAFTYNSGRKKYYCKENRFVASRSGSIEVKKKKLYRDPYPPDLLIRQQLGDEPYFNGRLLSGDILEIVSREGWTIGDLTPWALRYYEILRGYALAGGRYLEGKFLDLTPFNLLLDADNSATLFDQEWSCEEKVPLYFIFFRGLVYSLDKIEAFATPAAGTPAHLTALVIELVNRIFPFTASDLQECARLEEKYFSPVPLSPGKVFAQGLLKIRRPIRHLRGLLLEKEEVIARQETELQEKNQQIEQLTDELNQDNERQARAVEQLRQELGVEYRESEAHRGRREALEKEVAWYKRTYEDRSFAGVVKEKLHRAIRRRMHNVIRRLLNNDGVKGKYVLVYVLEYVRDQGLRKFLSLYAGIVRAKGWKALLHPREALLPQMQHKPDDDRRIPTALSDTGPDLEQLKEDLRSFTRLPKISIIFPTYNTEPFLLRMAIDSIREQVYTNWELCIADDHSTRQDTLAMLHSYSTEPRIRVKILPENSGISEASNAAIEMATGDYLALMDHDDALTPDALFRIVQELNQQGEADIFYSDECKVDEQGTLSDYFFKPDWSPELLLNMMYPGHLTVYRKDFLLKEVGVFRKEYDFSQDYDLMLRATEKTTRIRHIPKVLYHWRMTAGSAAQGDKPFARQTNLAALEDAIKRRGIKADVLELPPANRVRLTIHPAPKVSIIIPTDSRDNLAAALESILGGTSYTNYEVVVVTNSRLIKEMGAHFRLGKPDPGESRPAAFDQTKLLFVPYDRPYNFSDKCNDGAEHAGGEILIFFNDDVRPLQHDWIENTFEYLYIPGVGGVSPKLIYENDTLQYAGMATGVRNLTGTTLHGYQKDSLSYVNYPQLVRNVTILSGACLAMRKSLFFQIGKFDAFHTPSAHSDTDLSFRILECGLRCVYTPYASLRHIGHLSLKEHEKKEAPLKKDKADIFLLKRWMKYVHEDPYFTLPMRDYLYHDSPEHFRIYPFTESRRDRSRGDILAVTHDLSLSGAPISLYDTCKLLAANGYFVIVCSPADGPLRQMYQEAGIAVITDALLLRQHESFYRFARNFDHLICNTIVTWPVVRQLSNVLPTLWWIQEGQVLESFVANPDCRNTLRSAPLVIGLSDYALSYIRKYNPGAIKIYNACYDIREEGRDRRGLENPMEMQAPREKLVFSLIGSLEERKGQDILLEAIGLLEDQLLSHAEFRLIGRRHHPNFVLELERKARQLEQRTGRRGLVRFMGQLDHELCLDAIRDSDVMINASRDEPLSVVLVEAFCLAKPCIVSENTGIAELVKDGSNGYIFRHQDAADLAKKIRSVLEEPGKLIGVGLGARAIYEEHLSMDHFEKKILSLLESGTGLENKNNMRNAKKLSPA